MMYDFHIIRTREQMRGSPIPFKKKQRYIWNILFHQIGIYHCRASVHLFKCTWPCWSHFCLITVKYKTISVFNEAYFAAKVLPPHWKRKISRPALFLNRSNRSAGMLFGSLVTLNLFKVSRHVGWTKPLHLPHWLMMTMEVAFSLSPPPHRPVSGIRVGR